MTTWNGVAKMRLYITLSCFQWIWYPFRFQLFPQIFLLYFWKLSLKSTRSLKLLKNINSLKCSSISTFRYSLTLFFFLFFWKGHWYFCEEKIKLELQFNIEEMSPWMEFFVLNCNFDGISIIHRKKSRVFLDGSSVLIKFVRAKQFWNMQNT